MKLMTFILIPLISISVFAKENSCTTCTPLIKLTHQSVKNKTDLQKIQKMLMSFEFSKDPGIRSQEAQAYLKLVLKARVVDNMSTSAEYFYNFYEANRETFDAEIPKMNATDQKTIRNCIKGVGELRKPDKLKQ